MNYDELTEQLNSLLSSERDFMANSAQLCAFIFQMVPDLNWAGFYWLKNKATNDSEKELVLGPFQGKVACVRIPLGQGVCGTAAATGETQLIGNVHEFDGHIACDAASNSEVVIPIKLKDEVVGVFDIDSPTFNRFSENDALGLQQLVRVYMTYTDFSQRLFEK